VGRDSVVGIATRYGLDGAGIAFRKRRGFPCRPERSGAHPASYTLGTGSVPGVKRPGREINHIPPSSADIEERIELNHFYPSDPSWLVTFTFTFMSVHYSIKNFTFIYCVNGSETQV